VHSGANSVEINFREEIAITLWASFASDYLRTYLSN